MQLQWHSGCSWVDCVTGTSKRAPVYRGPMDSKLTLASAHTSEPVSGYVPDIQAKVVSLYLSIP